MENIERDEVFLEGVRFACAIIKEGGAFNYVGLEDSEEEYLRKLIDSIQFDRDQYRKEEDVENDERLKNGDETVSEDHANVYRDKTSKQIRIEKRGDRKI